MKGITTKKKKILRFYKILMCLLVHHLFQYIYNDIINYLNLTAFDFSYICFPKIAFVVIVELCSCCSTWRSVICCFEQDTEILLWQKRKGMS